MIATLPGPLSHLAGWLPFWQGAGFFVATFLLEDAATVGAGLLLAAGAVSGPVAFFSCFAGVWLGDAGLYALARYGGRPWFEHSSLKRFSGRVRRWEGRFAEYGPLILVFSRCLPGARLPTYLAAGFLRLPLPRFLLVTGLAAFGWTLLVLLSVRQLGPHFIGWFGIYDHAALVLLALGFAGFVAIQRARARRTDFGRRLPTARIERWRHWEFWPVWLFYPPVVLNYFRLAVKYRGLALPAAANPGIFSGGLVGESKFALLRQLSATSPEFTAEAALVARGTLAERLQSLEAQRARLRLDFPFVLKPDLGQRGAGVKLIRNQQQAAEYLRQTAAPLVAQRYVSGPGEAGVFYYRLPQEPQGEIFGIVEKIFPFVTGDGQSAVSQLVERDPRARLIAHIYARRHAARWDEILPAGETLRLVEAGNHAQGCVFRDGARLRSPALAARIDEISRRLDGFFIGRYDIRFADEDDLRAGRNFQIVELNGAAAEAAQIYDARNSLWSAYATLFRQWELIFRIGAENRRRGVAPAEVRTVWQAWRRYRKMAATYPVAD